MQHYSTIAVAGIPDVLTYGTPIQQRVVLFRLRPEFIHVQPCDFASASSIFWKVFLHV